jgi:hypothetical protein
VIVSAIRNVCRLYGLNRLDALQPEARLSGRLAKAATASSQICLLLNPSVVL